MIRQLGSSTMRVVATFFYVVSRTMEKVGKALITDSANLDSKEPPVPIKEDGTADTSSATIN